MFSLPVGTEMFHFPTFPPHALCVQARVTPHDWCGVPPFGHPRINARLAAPRGLTQPPTSFIGSWCPGIHRVPLTTWPHKKPHTRPRKETSARTYTNPAQTGSERCSRPLCSSQRTTRHPPHHPARPRPPHREPGGTRDRTSPDRGTTPGHPGMSAPSGPNSVPTDRTPAHHLRSTPPERAVLAAARRCRPNWSAFHPRAPPRTPAATSRRATDHGPGAALHHQPHTRTGGAVLLRKEVIQPHLPVRLPCYDFVPIADPAFDGSLPQGLGHRLRALPTFVT